MRYAILLLLAGIAAGIFLTPGTSHAEKNAPRVASESRPRLASDVHPPVVGGTTSCYSYAKTLKVGAPQANLKDRIRLRRYEAGNACNQKQEMHLLNSADGKPVLRHKGTAWLPQNR
jgi:hypothetical protein